MRFGLTDRYYQNAGEEFIADIQLSAWIIIQKQITT